MLQASELRAYIKSKGAEISEENSEGGLHVDLAQIIEACDVCLKDEDKGTWPCLCLTRGTLGYVISCRVDVIICIAFLLESGFVCFKVDSDAGIGRGF